MILVTGNKNKRREFQEITGIDFECLGLDIDEIQSLEVEKVIEDKVKKAFFQVGKPVVCEDTGLYFKEWNGLPGALIKFFGETVGYPKLCKMLKGSREATAKTAIGYFDGKSCRIFTGEAAGKISEIPIGSTAFGWDNIFIPSGSNTTFAQMGSSMKNSLSMRRKALAEFKKFIDSG